VLRDEFGMFFNTRRSFRFQMRHYNERIFELFPRVFQVPDAVFVIVKSAVSVLRRASK
jgi:hypothetical protein